MSPLLFYLQIYHIDI